ncbi:MAG TPA: glycosyltransferase family 4 protein [Vicinamibacterales bacterium]|jgi:glycosyltransferase involved in cell wall biosynthesis|nr:glycosyltransferase family 4 protein [Vicinamibacterales bacterium]
MPARLNVAFVGPSLDILGGQAVQADRLIRAWRGDPDVNAWLVPVNPRPPRVLSPIRRVKYARTIVNQLIYLPSLVRELAKADVVHVFSASYSSFLLAPLPAIRIARALRKPVLLNYRSGHAPKHLAGSAVARRAIASADLNVVPSQFLVDVFRGFGITATIVPNIVDLDRFRFSERTPLRPRLLSTRNFEALYDVACTLRAFELVQKRYPDASLTLVGGGPEEPKLRELVRDLDLRNVTFTGRVNPDCIADYYASHDIYVQSPTVDNMPTSILEAFASGLAVVSTNAGGIPVIVTHGTEGLLAPIGNHQAIADHVLHLLDHPDEGRKLTRAAFQTCQARTWANVREQWLNHYSTLAGAAPARRSHMVETPRAIAPGAER